MQFEPSQDVFAGRYDAGIPQLISTRIVADLETPVSAYLKVAGDNKNNFLLESVEGGEVRGRYSIIGIEPDIIFEAHGNNARINRNALQNVSQFETLTEPTFDALQSLLDESKIDVPDDLPPMAAGIYGYLGYETIGLVEEIPEIDADSMNVPDIRLLRPTVILVIDSVKNEITLITPARPHANESAAIAYNKAIERLTDTTDRIFAPIALTNDNIDVVPDAEPQSNTTQDEYFDMVRRAKDYIAAGDIFQVVLAQRFSTAFPYPSLALYRALRRTNPSPFLFYLAFEDFAVVGSSPEILVRLRDNEVTIRPIAGTRPRGKTREEDNALETELLADEKECAEHLMLLDLGRNDVGRVSELKSVKVTDSFFIERYSHVMHIVSNVIGQLKSSYTALQALMAGFPAGTVSGAPKIRAMEIIAELEKERRGVYAGCVGYFSADGNMDTCIALRTAVVKDNTLYVQAGAGIVADSDPLSEYQECQHKARALFTAASNAARYVNGTHQGHNAAHKG